MTTPKKTRDLRRARNNQAQPTWDASRNRYRLSVYLGTKPDGKPHNTTIRGRTVEEVQETAARLRTEVQKSGLKKMAGRRNQTLADWVEKWLESVERTKAASTYAFYRGQTANHVLPIAGDIKLRDVNQEVVESIVFQQGKSASTRKAVHRTIRACLGAAERSPDTVLTYNPASMVKVSPGDVEEVDPFDVHEVQALRSTARARDLEPARWDVALIVGLRQSEALGLRWRDVDFKRMRLHVRQTRQRQTWRHGCSDHSGCGKARSCPSRWRNEAFGPTKNRASRRVPLSDSVLESLRKQKVAQQRAKLATMVWQDHDLVFPTAEGTPRDHRWDARRWAELIEASGVRYERLHAARHTAATLLLRGHVDTRTVMDIMGWNEERMATLYRHVVDDMRIHAADSVDRLLSAVPPRSADAEA